MSARRFTSALLACAIAFAMVPAREASATACLDASQVPVPASGTGIRVKQLCRDQLVVPRLTNVQLTEPDRSVDNATLSINYPMADGTSVLVPFSSVVDIVSEHGNRTRGTGGVVVSVREAGPDRERYGVDGSGTASFDIANPLSLWSVFVGQRFIAAVHGTRFTADLTDPDHVTFLVTRGTVTITRFVSANILSTGQVLDGLRKSVRISPDGTPSVTYGRGPETYTSFKDPAEARARFQDDLTTATQAGDADAIENANDNLTTLAAMPAAPVVPQTPVAPPAAAAASASGPGIFLPIAIGAAIAGTIIYFVARPSRQTNPQNGGTQTGTVGATSRTRLIPRLPFGTLFAPQAKDTFEWHQLVLTERRS